MTPTGRWLLPLIAVVIIAGLLAAGISYLSEESLRADLPRLPELERYPPPVQRQLVAADADARAQPDSGDAVGGLAMAYHANNFPDQARVAYQLAMQVDRSNPRWPYLMGFLEMTAGRNERAITFLGKAVELDPLNAHGWARLGQLYFRRNALDQAEETYRQALEVMPTHSHAGVGMARVLGQKGDWAGAADKLAPCVEANPQYGPGQRMLALVYAELGRHADQKRHEDLGSDVGLHMRDPLVDELYALSSTGTILVTRGSIARLWGDNEAAEPLLRRAVDVAPSDKDVRLAMARLLTATATEARLREARTHLEKGLEVDPSYVVSRHDYATVLQTLGDTTAAVREWNTILEQEPEHAMALASLGQVAYFQKDYEKARSLYQRALDVPPDTPFMLGDSSLIWHRLALAHIQAGSPGKAPPCFRKAVEANPLLEEAYIHWSRLHRQQGKDEEALAVLEQGLEANPASAELNFTLGNTLIQLKRWREARESLLAARRLDPNNARVQAALGYAQLQLGDAEGAIQSLEAALRINANFPLALLHLGNAKLQAGRRDEAVAHFRRVLELQPGHPRAQEALARLGAQ